MAISFEQSLKNATSVVAENNESPIAVDDISVASMPAVAAEDGIATSDVMIAAYPGDLGTWKKLTRYPVFKEFTDTNYSIVNETKDIILGDRQFNISQEEHSQYIPFEMPRYYDGIDLTKFAITIHFTRKSGEHDYDEPINAEYTDTQTSSDKIHFGWLVSPRATKEAGPLVFEIHAAGTIIDNNRVARSYVWKSKSNKELVVLESMCDCNDAIEELDDTRIEQLVTDIAEAIADEIKYVSVGDQVAKAEASAKAAAGSATEAAGYVEDARQLVEDASGVATEAAQSVLANYATSEDLQNAINGIDVRDQLTDYVKTEDLTANHYTKSETDQAIITQLEPYTTEDDVKDMIAAEDISSKLENYYKKSETYSQSEVDRLLENVDVDLTGYAKESFVESSIGPIKAELSVATSNIGSLNSRVDTLDEALKDIDTSPTVYYRATYGKIESSDGTVKEDMFTLWEYEGDPGNEDTPRSSVSQFKITGGSNTGSTSSNDLSISYAVNEDGTEIFEYIFTQEDIANGLGIIKYDFTGVSPNGDTILSADAKWEIRIGRDPWTKVAEEIIYPGNNLTFDIGTFLASASTYEVQVTVTDESGALTTKRWKVQHLEFMIDSDFSDVNPYSGSVYFYYTPHGAINKTVHFVLDGEEIGTVETTSNGTPVPYSLPAQEHGSHLLDIYMTATVSGKDKTSNHKYKDILWQDPTSAIPLIGCATRVINTVQYNPIEIEYIVYDPKTETPEVTWYVDNESVITETLTKRNDNGYYVFSYKPTTDGTFELKVTCGQATPKIITVNVKKLDITVTPALVGLEFDFNPVGYSNSADNRLWSNNNVDMEVSPNFDWINGGYQTDNIGDQYFCVKAGTWAKINYNLFADDPRANGKEFKVIFRTTNIKKRDTSFIKCLSDGLGLDMKIEEAYVYFSDGHLQSLYCEDAIIEWEFNINKNTDIPMIMSYEDGTPAFPAMYNSGSTFKQTTFEPITIGSEDCDVHIYRMKAYSQSLKDEEIKNNFIADARNANELIARYNRNQIYNSGSNKMITTMAGTSGPGNVDALMTAAPDLRIIMLECPWFTDDKDTKIKGCKVYFRYKNGTRPEDNWDCVGVTHRGQGTSSNEYGYSGRNVDLVMDGDDSLFTWTGEDGKTVESKTITLTETSVPTDYLNIKVNIASSENANNAQLARRFNEYQPYHRYARVKDNRVKDTMEFHNCVLFIRETDPDISKHMEFKDCNWHFYAIGNVGDSKKTDDTRVNDKNDPKECVVEIMDVDKPLIAFPTGKENNEPCPIEEWGPGNSAYDVLYSEYGYDDGKFESFGQESFEFRYEMKGITDEQRQENIDAWRDFYRFVVTAKREVNDDGSISDEFKDRLGEYFVVDSALYYYLFTERYTMVDNRAKNSFWHYGKAYFTHAEAEALGLDTSDDRVKKYIDDTAAAINGGYRWDLTFGYDMDTALGIDNDGVLAYSYGKEDIDYKIDGDPTSGYVFRAADSTFFCRLRDNFGEELTNMYRDRDAYKAWSSNSLITEWDNAQGQFPEELWRKDFERKYYRTYLGSSVDNSLTVEDRADYAADKRFLTEKFLGRKKYQRRRFEQNQDFYFATKHMTTTATGDQIYFRGHGSEVNGLPFEPNFSITVTAYSDMYAGVRFGSTAAPINKRLKAGETHTFYNNSKSGDFIHILGASHIQEIGDLSRCFMGQNDFTKATRLQKLVIGSTDVNEDGVTYWNSFMNGVNLSNNALLEHLDVRNVSGITDVIDVSGCGNLRELYAEGTNTSGVVFADGGMIRVAHLPAVASLTMKNLFYIEDFTVDGYEKLKTLHIENVPAVNTYEMVRDNIELAPDGKPTLNTVRLIGLAWDASHNVENGDELNYLLTTFGFDSATPPIQTERAVLSGSVYLINVRERELELYKAAWPDLIVTSKNTPSPQFLVTFVNVDEHGNITDVIEEQYVDEGGDAVAPNITPTLESSVSQDFEFVGWDVSLNGIYEPRTIKAVYQASPRKYKIQYASMGNVLPGYPVEAEYGSLIQYSGQIPTYTAEEGKPSYNYYLFKGWDKSGYLDGDFDENGIKTVNAEFDVYHYVEGDLDNLVLDGIDLVKLYAIPKLIKQGRLSLKTVGMDTSLGTDYSLEEIYRSLHDGSTVKVLSQNNQDSFEITVGNDVNYKDIDSVLLIEDGVCVLSGELNGKSATFTGYEEIDTGIKLFDEDKDFVIAIDYTAPDNNLNGATIMQCYDEFSSNGLKFYYSNSTSFKGTMLKAQQSTITISNPNKREMLVIRHKKGDPTFYVYKSYLDGDSVTETSIPANVGVNDALTLVFGASKNTAGYFVNKYQGTINWAKIWYKDLGPDDCRSLAIWTHEKVKMALSHISKYNLSDASGIAPMTFTALNLLSKTKSWGGNSNAGGWEKSTIKAYLNGRFYEALPMQMKQLIKKVHVDSSVGQNSTSLVHPKSECYIYIPAVIEVDPTKTDDPYVGEGAPVPYMTTNSSRIRTMYDSDEAMEYSTRSPYVYTFTSSTTSRLYYVSASGAVENAVGTSTPRGLLIMFSI